MKKPSYADPYPPDPDESEGMVYLLDSHGRRVAGAATTLPLTVGSHHFNMTSRFSETVVSYAVCDSTGRVWAQGDMGSPMPVSKAQRINFDLRMEMS